MTSGVAGGAATRPWFDPPPADGAAALPLVELAGVLVTEGGPPVEPPPGGCMACLPPP